MSKSRLFLYILSSFIAGVATGSFREIPISVIWTGFIAGLALAAARGFKNKKWVWGVLLIVFFIGIFRFEQVAQDRPDLVRWLGRDLYFTGVIWQDPDLAETSQRLKVKISSVGGVKISQPFFVLVTLRKYPAYKFGDEVKINGRLKEPENYEDFDYREYLAKEDVFATSFFPQAEKLGERKGGYIKLGLADVKNSFENKIGQILPEPYAAYLKGLLLGEKKSLPPDLIENLQKSGTSHLVVLSGYNITLVGRFFLFLLSLALVPFFISFWIATSGIILFVLATGASASAVRAAIMGILVLLAQKEGRVYGITNALVLAASLMVWQNPRILRFDAGFQLSFLATIGLVYLAPRLENFIDQKKNLFISSKKSAESGLGLKKILLETVSAQIMVLPLLIFLFGRVSLISPLTNMLILATVPYAMGIGFIGGLTGFISIILAQIIGWLVWIILAYQIKVVEIFGGLPGVSLELGRWAIMPVIILYVSVFVYWFRRQR